MDWVNIMIFAVIPVSTVGIIFFTRRNLLWSTPLISTVLAFITYMIALGVAVRPSFIFRIFSMSESRGFLLLAMLMHFGITVILTLLAYITSYILNHKQKR